MSKFETYVIKEINAERLILHENDGITKEIPLDKIITDPWFAGFRYWNGEMSPSIIGYEKQRNSRGSKLHWTSTVSALATGEDIIAYPTHAVFRERA